MCASAVSMVSIHPHSRCKLNVWTARTYYSRPRSPWKALSNWAVQQALERGCKLRSAWTTLRKMSLGIDIKHTIEKLDSWPKPVDLQRFMSTFSEYSPVSGRLFVKWETCVNTTTNQFQRWKIVVHKHWRPHIHITPNQCGKLLVGWQFRGCCLVQLAGN